MNNLNKLLVLLVLISVCGAANADFASGYSSGFDVGAGSGRGSCKKECKKEFSELKQKLAQCKTRVDSLQKTLENELDTIEWVEE